jgi:hypothetical protein
MNVTVKKLYGLCIVIAAISVSLVRAQIPRQISYQGMIVVSGGQPIADGNHTLELRIYDAPTTSGPLHSETQNIVTQGGIFNVVLGLQTPFPASLAFDRAYWLGVSVDGTSEMSPRTALIAAPYALNSSTADVAKSVSPDAVGVVTSLNELDGAVRIVNTDSSIRITQNGSVITLSVNFPEVTGIPFDLITTGVNKGQSLDVGDASVLKPVGNGIIESNKLSGATVSVDANSASYAGRVKIPRGAPALQVNLSPAVGCQPGSSVTVNQFDQTGNEVLIGTMVTDIAQDRFTVMFSAGYPTDNGYLTYLIVNP